MSFRHFFPRKVLIGQTVGGYNSINVSLVNVVILLDFFCIGWAVERSSPAGDFGAPSHKAVDS